MFCPGCGLKEERPVQYCRSCGTDLGLVRETLAQPEAASMALATAREEVARALAARIQQGEWWQTGALVSDMARLFESPDEKRLRLRHAAEAARLKRIRAGVITSAVGLGTILLFLLLSIGKPDLLLLAGPGLLVFLIGLAVMLNGVLFTLHKTERESAAEERKDGASLRKLVEKFGRTHGALQKAGPPTDALSGDRSPSSFVASSVTEQTTRHLSNES